MAVQGYHYMWALFGARQMVKTGALRHSGGELVHRDRFFQIRPIADEERSCCQ